MTMTQAWDLKVALEYGQFSLETGRAEDMEYWDPEDDDLEILNQAQGWDGTEYAAPKVAPGIAQGRYTTIVVAPHRDNFDMNLRVEIHDGPPVDDLADWQDVFEATVEAGPTGIWYRSPQSSRVRSSRFPPAPTACVSAGVISCVRNGSMTVQAATTTSTGSSSGPTRSRSNRSGSSGGTTPRAAVTSKARCLLPWKTARCLSMSSAAARRGRQTPGSPI